MSQELLALVRKNLKRLFDEHMVVVTIILLLVLADQVWRWLK